MIVSNNKGDDKRKCRLTDHFQKQEKCVVKPLKSSLHKRRVQFLGDVRGETMRNASFYSGKQVRTGDVGVTKPFNTWS
jgi:hypothetical protein